MASVDPLPRIGGPEFNSGNASLLIRRIAQRRLRRFGQSGPLPPDRAIDSAHLHPLAPETGIQGLLEGTADFPSAKAVRPEKDPQSGLGSAEVHHARRDKCRLHPPRQPVANTARARQEIMEHSPTAVLREEPRHSLRFSWIGKAPVAGQERGPENRS
jgi:hypothetical protein